MANTHLLKENEVGHGVSADPSVALAMGNNPDLMNTFETLPDEEETVVQQQYPRS